MTNKDDKELKQLIATNQVLVAKVKEAIDNFEKYIGFTTLDKIHKIYDADISKYVEILDLIKSKNENDFKKVNIFIQNFKIDSKYVQLIIGVPCIDGKYVRIAKFVLDEVERRGIIKCLNHRNLNYKSGKTFTCSNCYYLSATVAKKLINNKDAYNTNSSFYTKKQHKLIDKYYFKYNNKAAEEVSKKEISQQDICHINPVQKEISQQNTQPATSSKPAIVKPEVVTPAISKPAIVKKEIMKKNDDIIDEQDVLSPNSVNFQTKLRHDLQSVIDKGYISPKCGRRLWSYIYNNENVQFNMTHGGYVYGDSSNVENTTKRAKVLMLFFNEYSKCMSEKNKEKLQNDISVALLNLKTQNVDISVYFNNKQNKEVV